MIDYYSLRNIAGKEWGFDDILLRNTKVNGIYDVSTSRHGGYLVDINIHPELEKYGYKTGKSNINAFEEDYEALKVLWLYPELINNNKDVESWLNKKTVIRFDSDDSFLKDFPERNLYPQNKTLGVIISDLQKGMFGGKNSLVIQDEDYVYGLFYPSELSKLSTNIALQELSVTRTSLIGDIYYVTVDTKEKDLNLYFAEEEEEDEL